MKIPRVRLPGTDLFGRPLPAVDRFGYSRTGPGLIAAGPKDWPAEMKKLAADAFCTIANHIGEDEARRLFGEFAKAPAKGRGKAALLAQDRDEHLLAAAHARPKHLSIEAVARHLHSK